MPKSICETPAKRYGVYTKKAATATSCLQYTELQSLRPMFYHVFCINRKKTISPSFKKNKVIFFSQVFTFLIYLKIVSHVANLPISHQGPLNCISTHVSIKVNVFIPKNIYHIHNYVQKSMTNCLFRDKYSFSS